MSNKVKERVDTILAIDGNLGKPYVIMVYKVLRGEIEGVPKPVGVGQYLIDLRKLVLNYYEEFYLNEVKKHLTEDMIDFVDEEFRLDFNERSLVWKLEEVPCIKRECEENACFELLLNTIALHMRKDSSFVFSTGKLNKKTNRIESFPCVWSPNDYGEIMSELAVAIGTVARQAKIPVENVIEGIKKCLESIQLSDEVRIQ